MKLTRPGNAGSPPNVDPPVTDPVTTGTGAPDTREGAVPSSPAPSGMTQTDEFREEAGQPPSAVAPGPHLFSTDDIIAGGAPESQDLIRGRVQALCMPAEREFVEDWRQIREVACEMGDVGIAAPTRLELLAALKAAREHLGRTEPIRAAFLLQRGANGIDAVSHKDALRWATEGSAACLRRPELGRIAVGAAADLALFRLDELRFSGAGDPIAALVLCGAHRADRVMVAGRWVVVMVRSTDVEATGLCLQVH